MKFRLNVGDEFKVYKDAMIEPYSNIAGRNIQTIGAFSYSNTPLVHGISIGRYCSIGHNMRVLGADHLYQWISSSPHFYTTEYQDRYTEESIGHFSRNSNCINIGHDVWIGDDVSIKKCINIGNGAILAAKCLVTKDVPPFCIVGGVPAQVIKYRFEKEIIDRIIELQWWRYNLHDLKNMHADKPAIFLDMLERRIMNKDIEEYCPECIDEKIIGEYAD